MNDPSSARCAITLHEPWATLLAIGAQRGGKGNETRDWSTDYRGPLAIHAGKTIDQDVCWTEPFFSVLSKHFGTSAFMDRFRLGYIIATCELLHVERAEVIRPVLSEVELAFGGYGPGRFAWVTDYPILLPRPIPARGLQKLWYLSAEQREEIMRQTPQAALEHPPRVLQSVK